MSRFEKISLLILTIMVSLASLLVMLWSLKDLDKLFSDLLLGLVAGPIIGLITGKVMSDYYRRKDKNQSIAYASYGLQVHLRKIATRLDDLMEAEKKKDSVAWEANIDKLRETLHDEPYAIFLTLDDTNLDEPYRSSRIDACMVVAQLENLFLYSNLWPSYLEMVEYRSAILKARSELLRLSSTFRKLSL